MDFSLFMTEIVFKREDMTKARTEQKLREEADLLVLTIDHTLRGKKAEYS